MKEIVILHEYGDKRHFRALEYLINTKYKSNVQLIFREFTPFMGIARSIKQRRLQLFKKQIVNIWNLFSLLLSRDRLVILGMAPYDYRVILLDRILLRHKIFYFTSWPYWDYSFYPKKIFAKGRIIRNAWKKFIEKDISGIFTVTETACRNLKNYYNVTKPCSVVYHSYDESVYFSTKSNYAVSVHKPMNCLFVGRLELNKGVDRIIKIVEDLPMDKFRFHFVGGGSFVKDIQELSQSFNNVIYYGYIKDEHILADIYRKADVLLLPSRKGESWEELFGLVIIEAMACGAVVMSTDHIGPKELIVNNYNGFIFPEEKFVESASQELLKLYSERLRLEEMRRNSINFSKKFSEKEISKRWDIILRNYLE